MLFLFILITIVSFVGCTSYSEMVSAEVQIDELENENLNSQEETISVEYQESWHFEPYSKYYYIEPEKWGGYGLEQDTNLAKENALDQLELAADEHVVYMQVH